MADPYQVVRDFEAEIADYAGSKYAVAVESGSAAIFLSCLVSPMFGKFPVHLPARTYPSVPCAIIHAGGAIEFVDRAWEGVYALVPYAIWDGALRFRRGMFMGGLHCLSFHSKKHLPIGRGGMILTDHAESVERLRLLRFDGRTETPMQDGEIKCLGWNMYMEPEQAARGLVLFNTIKGKDLQDLKVEDQGYPDLRKYEFYQ